MGDLNCNLLKINKPSTKLLLTILEIGNLVIKNEGIFSPTRVTKKSATCIDLIAVDRGLDISNYVVSNLAISDHFPVVVDLDAELATQNNLVKPVYRRSFKKVDFNELGRKVASIQLDTHEPVQLDLQLQKWNAHFIATLDEVAPMRPFPRLKKKPTWVDSDTRGLMRLRASKAKKLRLSNPQPEDFELVRNLKKCIKSRVRASIKCHGEKIMSMNEPRETWKFIRKATFTQTKGAKPLIDIDEANNFFAEIVGAVSLQNTTANNRVEANSDEEEFDITPLEVNRVVKLLQRVKTNTSTGPDDIPAFLIRTLAYSIAPNLTTLYNASLSSGIYPTQWKKANVIPIYKKKGAKSEVGNYRPISILPVLGRVLEKYVCNQLQQFCDLNDVIPMQQFGFRKHSSCELALLAALDSWLMEVSSGKFVGALLIDLTRAFDSISHLQLIQELENIRCSQSTVRWITSFLSDRQQRVKLGTDAAPWMPVRRGVPQGSPLSPLLFNIIVRHLPLASQTAAYQFADDLTNSVAHLELEELSSNLQNMFSRVDDFCKDRNLEINLSKTQLIIFKPTGKKIPDDFGVAFNNTTLKPAPTVKLLGVTLDQHFTMGAHIDIVVKKCHGLLGMLRRSSAFLPRDLRKLVFTSVIRSQLEFCSSTFINAAPTHLKKLDIIQKIASRIITDSSPQTHSAPLQLQLGLDSLSSRRNNHAIALVSDIVIGKTHPYFKDFFSTEAQVPSRTLKKLETKRFSRFGLALYNDITKSKEASNGSVEPVLRGHLNEQSSSQISSTASSPRSLPQQTTNARDARSGIDDKIKTSNK